MKFRTLCKSCITWLINFHIIVRLSNFGKGSYIGKRCSIHFSPQGKIEIGNRVRIGDDARLAVYEKGSIIIHDSVYMGSHISIITAAKVEIEENVLLASYINILGHNHGMNPESTQGYGEQSLVAQPVTIRANAWIGQDVSILPGVTIGEKSIIGCGSVVTKSIPDFSIAVGNPAKVIKRYNFKTHRWE